MPDANKPRRDGHRYLRTQIEQLQLHLQPALKGSAQAIHEMRVSARRLRATLPFLVKDPDSHHVRQLRRMLRRLTKASSGIRDLDVQVEMLSQLPEFSARERARLVRSLRAAKQRTQQRMLRELQSIKPSRLRQRLTRALDNVVKADKSLARIQDFKSAEWNCLAGSLAKMGRRFYPDRLHTERRRIRRMRYVAELQDHLLRQDSTSTSTLRQMQAQLGDVHDAHVMSQWLQARGATQPGRLLDRRARTLHKRWLASHPLQRLESEQETIQARRAP